MAAKTLVLVGLLALVVGVACTGLRRPDVFLLPKNRITWEEGERLVREGERAVNEGERKIEEGREMRERADRLIDEGRDQRKEGEATLSRGRRALGAARMLEEAEELRLKGEDLRQHALPTP